MTIYVRSQIKGVVDMTTTLAEFRQWASEYLFCQPNFEGLRVENGGVGVRAIRQDNNTSYGAEYVALYVVRPGSRLETIAGDVGLVADYGGGKLTATVWQDDYEPSQYVLVCQHKYYAHPHLFIDVKAHELEDKMRDYCSDLRKWRRVHHIRQA